MCIKMHRKQPSFYSQYSLSACYEPDTVLGNLDVRVPKREAVLLPERGSLSGKANMKLILLSVITVTEREISGDRRMCHRERHNLK